MRRPWGSGWELGSHRYLRDIPGALAHPQAFCSPRGLFLLNSRFWSTPSWRAKTIVCCSCGSWFLAVTPREVLSLVAESPVWGICPKQRSLGIVSTELGAFSSDFSTHGLLNLQKWDVFVSYKNYNLQQKDYLYLTKKETTTFPFWLNCLIFHEFFLWLCQETCKSRDSGVIQPGSCW